jgi:hypothetical protein
MKQDLKKNKVGIPSTTSIQLFGEFVKFLNSCTQNKCPYLNCKRESKKVKKEGASKIFLIDREADDEEEGKDAASTNFRKKSRDSLSRGGESTAHPSLPDKESKKSKQRYITPKEVYNELRKIWQN